MSELTSLQRWYRIWIVNRASLIPRDIKMDQAIEVIFLLYMFSNIAMSHSMPSSFMIFEELRAKAWSWRLPIFVTFYCVYNLFLCDKRSGDIVDVEWVTLPSNTIKSLSNIISSVVFDFLDCQISFPTVIHVFFLIFMFGDICQRLCR